MQNLKSLPAIHLSAGTRYNIVKYENCSILLLCAESVNDQ